MLVFFLLLLFSSQQKSQGDVWWLCYVPPSPDTGICSWPRKDTLLMVCPSPGACSREVECLDVCLMQTKDQLPNYLLLLLLTVCCSAARLQCNSYFCAAALPLCCNAALFQLGSQQSLHCAAVTTRFNCINGQWAMGRLLQEANSNT